ncbi:MAG: hypothetical protein ACI88L_000378 [Candidatus Paceibacteria bacterium]|jgi:hypothetical protein
MKDFELLLQYFLSIPYRGDNEKFQKFVELIYDKFHGNIKALESSIGTIMERLPTVGENPLEDLALLANAKYAAEKDKPSNKGKKSTLWFLAISKVINEKLFIYRDSTVYLLMLAVNAENLERRMMDKEKATAKEESDLKEVSETTADEIIEFIGRGLKIDLKDLEHYEIEIAPISSTTRNIIEERSENIESEEATKSE